MFKPQRKTKKSQRARELIASLYQIPLDAVRDDVKGLQAMYANLQTLGFEWVADANEWLNPRAVDPANALLFTFVIGSPTHPVEEAASLLTDALEKMGYQIIRTDIMVNMADPLNSLARIEVLK